MDDQREILNQLILAGATQEEIQRQSEIVDGLIAEYYRREGQA